MADFDALTYHRLIGRYNGIVADTTGPLGDAGTSPDLYAINARATITLGVARNGKLSTDTPELRLPNATPPRTLLLVPIRAQLESGILRLPGATDAEGVDLVARSGILGIAPADDLVVSVTFDNTTIGGLSYKLDTVRYVVPTIEAADYHAGEVQVVSLTGNPEGGQWALIYGGHPMAMVPHNAAPATVQDRLRAIVGQTAVSVDPGPDGGPYWVRFNTAVIPRPLPLGGIDNLTGGSLPDVKVEDQWAMPTIDLTTVERWVAA